MESKSKDGEGGEKEGNHQNEDKPCANRHASKQADNETGNKLSFSLVLLIYISTTEEKELKAETAI